LLVLLQEAKSIGEPAAEIVVKSPRVTVGVATSATLNEPLDFAVSPTRVPPWTVVEEAIEDVVKVYEAGTMVVVVNVENLEVPKVTALIEWQKRGLSLRFAKT
jgi:hypothetical protein